MFRRSHHLIIGLTLAWVIGAALIGAASAQSADCSRYETERARYVGYAVAGIMPHVDAMASQRGVAREVATFYWAGSLIRAGDTASANTLADLTLASSTWPGQAARAREALEHMFAEDRNLRAGFLAGLMLSGPGEGRDPYRARAYLADVARAGRPTAQAFLDLFDACHGRRLAMQ